jgi:hypothetical protein
VNRRIGWVGRGATKLAGAIAGVEPTFDGAMAELMSAEHALQLETTADVTAWREHMAAAYDLFYEWVKVAFLWRVGKASVQQLHDSERKLREAMDLTSRDVDQLTGVR